MHPLFDLSPAELARVDVLGMDQALLQAAIARDGVLSSAQLRALGLTPAAVARRVRRGVLHARHRGVFAVGRPDLTPQGRRRAALLRCGPTAALSLWAAAGQADLLTPRGRVDVTVLARGVEVGRGDGIALRRTRSWRSGDVVWRHGLPCTSVARTLADLAGKDARAFTRAWNAADGLHLLDVGELEAQIVRGRAGAGRLRARLARYEEAPPTESELELLAYELFRAQGVPLPVCQWVLGDGPRPGRVDFVWPDERVALEVDGRRWHAVQDAWERDRARDLQLRVAGYDAHRYGYRQVRDDGPAVARVLLDALSRGRLLGAHRRRSGGRGGA